MRCLTIGAPGDLATDVGPVISEASRLRLRSGTAERIARRGEAAVLPAQLDAQPRSGAFSSRRHLFELRSLDQAQDEDFGPILHLARYRSGQLPSG